MARPEGVEGIDLALPLHNGAGTVATLTGFKIERQRQRMARIPLFQIGTGGMRPLMPAKLSDDGMVVMPLVEQVVEVKEAILVERHAVANIVIAGGLPVI